LKRRPNKSKAGRKPESSKASGQNLRVEPILPPSPRRKWLFRFIALVVLPLILLGGLEFVLRLAGYGYTTGFFEKIRVGGREFLVDNVNFSLRFFPPRLAREPGPVMMALKKPANTYRIFILGESAARGEPDPAYAASRYLEVLLDERFPNTHFEVVNLGITAIDSHVILPIARDCAKADGDLWIIYMGNNEMVGPFGAATVFGAKAPPLGLVRLNLAIQKTRVGQLLVDLSRRLMTKSSNASWGGMKMFVGNQLRADDPRKEVVYQNFARNLNDIIRAGLNSGAKILLNTVAVNLEDCPPFGSLVNSNLPAVAREQFNQLYTAGCAAAAQNNDAGAVLDFEQAAKLDPLFPALQYRWAECLLAQTNFVAARAHFQLACDDDALPFRADSRINGAIQKAARQFAGDQLVFFDAPAALDKILPSGICGRETFYEHVHFNPDGNFRLGRAWAEQVEKMLPADISRGARTEGWLAQAACDQLLGLTDWNQAELTEMMIDRLQHPPLSDQSNNAERLQSLRDAENKLRQRMDPAASQKAGEIYRAAIERAPQDHLLRENFAEFLEATGDLKQAVAQWRQVQELLPHSSEPWYQAGRLLSELAQWNEAEATLTKAVTLSPRLAEGWYELGDVHLGAGKFEAALQDYNQARQLDPENATYYAYAGKALSKLDRHAAAIQLYRQAIQMQPGLWEAHFGLADELSVANQFAGAADEYEQVIRLRPTLALAHLDRGVMLTRAGQFDGAQQEFQATLQLEPGNRQAQEYSERVQKWKSQLPQ
jgi:tetratricopeptide (TPR) repeat protein